MSKIHVLPIHLVNKIAAGEVIERPASIVKELVENALDAGATRIDVACEDGGKRLIAVSDNGCGMGNEDLALAFVPHATSKIAAEDDLFAINTMGFRGEALASIASVSHANIRTRRQQAAQSSQEPSPDGCEIDASDESVGQVRPCAAAGGTTVTIRDLFFNTPARRKFMKSANTELGHITEQIIRLALPHPQVAFTLTHNGRTVQSLPACSGTLARAADVFGRDVSDALVPIVARGNASIAVAGLAGKPAAARASANWQYFFLNGRYVRDRLLGHALKESYRGLLEPSRFPVAFIFLQVDPAEVDVNVHPTKVEVRFRDGQAVHGELLAALRETLNRANLAPAAHWGDAKSPAIAGAGQDSQADSATAPQNADAVQTQRESVRQAIADFFKSAPAPQPRLAFGESAPPAWTQRQGQPYTAPGAVGLGEAAEGSYVSQDSPTLEASPLPAPADADEQAAERSAHTLGTGAALQVHNSYIIAQSQDGLVIIDQHALHERLLYNELKRRLTDGKVDAQRLLIPRTLTVTTEQALAAEENADLLSRLGVELESFGPQTLAVQSLPLLLTSRNVDGTDFIRELLDQLIDTGSASGEKLIEHLLETMACKAAVKAGDPLTQTEIDALLRRREEAEKSSACPHGRPTALKLSLKDLEKQFKRT